MKKIIFSVLSICISTALFSQYKYKLEGSQFAINNTQSNLHLHSYDCPTGNPSGKAGCSYLTRFTMTNYLTTSMGSKGFVIDLTNTNVNIRSYSGNMGMSVYNGPSFYMSQTYKRMFFGIGGTNSNGSSYLGAYNFNAGVR